MNMAVANSSVKKGETLIDTAMTLNAMKPDALVIRHSASGGAKLLSRKVDCAVLNAGDGTHEHPTQALLDLLTIRRTKGRIEGLKVVICGDIAHSRVARSTTMALHLMGARVHLCGPRTLIPPGTDTWGAESAGTDFDRVLLGADVVMMLRLQLERMNGSFLPSQREYFRYFGLTADRLALAKDDAIVMHPGPMNRGVEIESSIADGTRSVITQQVRWASRCVRRCCTSWQEAGHEPRDCQRALAGSRNGHGRHRRRVHRQGLDQGVPYRDGCLVQGCERDH
jgi:aspartate carbamoyltransferase catalytic subunit